MHEWSTGQRIALARKIREFDSGEISKIEDADDQTQYLLILHEEERYKIMAWVCESQILGLYYQQLKMGL